MRRSGEEGCWTAQALDVVGWRRCCGQSGCAVPITLPPLPAVSSSSASVSPSTAAKAAFTASLFKSIHYPNEVVLARRGSPLLIGVKTDKKLKVDFVDIEFAGQDNDAKVDSLQPQSPGSMLAPPPVSRAGAPRRSSRRRKSVLCTLPDLRVHPPTPSLAFSTDREIFGARAATQEHMADIHRVRVVHIPVASSRPSP
ncbi:hypothetical protein B0H17DRAFT_1206569 [Mycena rosella]|uniref:Uncharacterized protein n=1 Tax=Mycena rosella TaxID=1033263 RepID=A0AAD7D4R1_MYCRO|nr:hypothetical protein B0H17DRAFT_1206569 [Mycena rosella]